MQAMNEFRWGQGKVEEVTGMSREQRESSACVRRLEQMAKKHEKQEKREANRLAAMHQTAAKRLKNMASSVSTQTDSTCGVSTVTNGSAHGATQE